MRAIDADALAKNMQAITVTEVTKKGFRHLNRSVVLLTDVYKAPTIDAVPVVRCRECKHWKRYKPNSEYGDCNQWRQSNDENAETSADDFCSYGATMDKEEPS